MEPPQKQRQKEQRNSKAKKDEADGEDAPEPVQTVTKEMMAETTYEVKDGTQAMRSVAPEFPQVSDA